jgi:hypothetical protein
MSNSITISVADYPIAVQFISLLGYSRYTPKYSYLSVPFLALPTNIPKHSNIFYSSPDSIVVTTMNDDDAYTITYYGDTLDLNVLKYYVKHKGNTRSLVLGIIASIGLCVACFGTLIAFILLMSRG